MPFEVLSRHLGEVVVFAAKAHEDNRGYFLESYREDQFRELGLPGIFVQDNHSYSKKGVVRGLHAQWDPPMGRLMKVTLRVYLVASCDRTGTVLVLLPQAKLHFYVAGPVNSTFIFKSFHLL